MGFLEGVSRRCLERPLGEYDPLGLRPTLAKGDEIARTHPSTNHLRAASPWLSEAQNP